MSTNDTAWPDAWILDEEALGRFIALLRGDGFQVVGPGREGGAVVLRMIGDVGDLVAPGWSHESTPGSSRPRRDPTIGRFAHGLSPQAWKRWLYPPSERLWRGLRHANGYTIDPEPPPPAPLALLGVAACDLAALRVLDRVLADTGADPVYARRRRDAFVVAVNCTNPAETCFCASMAAGPGVSGDHDVAFTDMMRSEGGPLLMAESGSARGQALLNRTAAPAAPPAARRRAAEAVTGAATRQRRAMVDNAANVLGRSLDSPHWATVAERCLTCGNCTLVCPTCFCASVEDSSDLAGDVAERWRHWDSCFTVDFSYIHGGSIRSSAESRYRQWITHKLSTWWEQFGCSGCVGCGRCITWCPVGIDITEEAAALRDALEREATDGVQ